MLCELLGLNKEDRKAIVDLFKALSLGGSKQKKLFNLLRDAAYKHESSIHQFLLNEDLATIISDENLNVPLKIQHLDKLLQVKIKPKSHEAEAAFSDQVKTLKLAKNQKLIHSPAFERDAVTLVTEFVSLDQCRSYLQNTSS